LSIVVYRAAWYMNSRMPPHLLQADHGKIKKPDAWNIDKIFRQPGCLGEILEAFRPTLADG
jgi:hypothetical protein